MLVRMQMRTCRTVYLAGLLGLGWHWVWHRHKQSVSALQWGQGAPYNHALDPCLRTAVSAACGLQLVACRTPTLPADSSASILPCNASLCRMSCFCSIWTPHEMLLVSCRWWLGER